MQKIDLTRRISIEVAGDIVTFICRTPTGDEQSKFLNSRFVTKRNKVESHVYEARAAFMDKITVDIEGVTYANSDGDEMPLNAATSLSDADKAKYGPVFGVTPQSFRDFIPVSWKSSAAQQFEDSANTADEGVEKN